MNLYVGNLSYNADQQSVSELFESHGEVTSVKIITDRETGRARGFGFVEMPNKKEAVAAMSALADTQLDGRAIVVNEARPRNNQY